MKNILCLSDSLNDIQNFVKNAQLLFFPIEQIDPEEHSFLFFREIYEKLKESTDLSQVDFIIAEYIEAIPLVYLMRKDGYMCPAIFIPHTNPYPLNILFYFLLVSHFSHPADLVLCGSEQAAQGYKKLVNINAVATCTFGIKNHFKKGCQQTARNELGIPQEKKYLLFTGRFMNDKGLTSLLEVYDYLKSRVENLGLLLSVTHIDPDYYNMLAPHLEDSILFYRLDKKKMLALYQSADLFVSLATSIFETYGKSPMEAIACGVPAILPKWDGFKYYISEKNGALADVVYSDLIDDAPYSFAKVDPNDFAEKCLEWLTKEECKVTEPLPEWAFYDHTMTVLSDLTQNILNNSQKFIKEFPSEDSVDLSSFPPVITDIFNFYELKSWEDLENKADQLGLINREEPGDLSLLRELHDLLFQTMDGVDSHIDDKQLTTSKL